MAGYRTDLDICNRALQLCRLNPIVRFTDSNWQAIGSSFIYEKMRAAVLENNTWSFALRRAVLRPVDTVTAVLETGSETLSGTVLPFASTEGVVAGQLVQGTNIAAGATVASFVVDTSVTLSIAITGTVAAGAAITFGPLTFLWTPPAYAAGTTYAVGHVVTYDGEWWQSKVAANLGNTPGLGDYWRRYIGPDTMQTWDDEVSYFPGELALGTNGTVYLALIGSNEDHDPTSTTGFWLAVNGTTAGLSILYPIGTGPASDGTTADVYRLPRGFLRRAPTAPKSGLWEYLGAPQGLARDDWVFENGYIVSASRGPLLIRYVGDVIDVPEFDNLFCEMLAGHIADAIAPQLAAPDTLQIVLATIARHLAMIRRQAIGANGILIGSTDAPVDSYLTCRL